jgi:hypothetical protein
VNRRSHLRAALGLILGLAFLPRVMAQEAASRAELPSGESILDRYVEVTGGAAAYKSRTSEAVTGTFAITAAGLTGQLQAFLKPGLHRLRIELPGVGVIESGVKDGVAWANDPFAGPRIVTGFQAELAIGSARPGAAAYWRERYPTVKTTGIEDVNGEPAYRVVHTLAKGDSLTGLYSVGSGLLLKLEFSAEVPVEQFLEAYAGVEGILTPTRVVQMAAGQRIVMTFTSLETNVEIPDERFDLPEGVQALLK